MENFQFEVVNNFLLMLPKFLWKKKLFCVWKIVHRVYRWENGFFFLILLSDKITERKFNGSFFLFIYLFFFISMFAKDIYARSVCDTEIKVTLYQQQKKFRKKGKRRKCAEKKKNQSLEKLKKNCDGI